MLAWEVTSDRHPVSSIYNRKEMDVSTNKEKTKHEIPSLKSLERDFGQKFAYPASTKTYLQGSRPDVKAPIRMIGQLSTRAVSYTHLTLPTTPYV